MEQREYAIMRETLYIMLYLIEPIISILWIKYVRCLMFKDETCINIGNLGEKHICQKIYTECDGKKVFPFERQEAIRESVHEYSESKPDYVNVV
jgi:hypothetical protein